MKKLILSLLATIVLTASLAAQTTTEVFTLASGTPLNLLAAAKVISNVTALNSSTNVNIIRFYDSATNTTNYAQAAYVSYASYPTNYNVVFTNQTGVLVTNTFSGTFTQPTTVSGSTVTLKTVYVLGIPGSGAANKDVRILPMRGLTALATQDAVVTVTYSSN